MKAPPNASSAKIYIISCAKISPFTAAGASLSAELIPHSAPRCSLGHSVPRGARRRMSHHHVYISLVAPDGRPVDSQPIRRRLPLATGKQVRATEGGARSFFFFFIKVFISTKTFMKHDLPSSCYSYPKTIIGKSESNFVWGFRIEVTYAVIMLGPRSA